MSTSCSNYAKKASNDVVGGKTARACDNCVKKRARWYCAADDAFLCQACDHSVHSANSLARRHERVRLKTASSSSSTRSPPPLKPASDQSPPPTWHRGITRKARTPRHGNHASIRGLMIKSDKTKGISNTRVPNPFSLVPEFGGDETSHEENEEQLLYRVPTYDPLVAQLCCASGNEVSKTTSVGTTINNDNNGTSPEEEEEEESNNNLRGFLLPGGHDEMDDLAEFAADVESLLGSGLENDECFGMEGLGFVDCKDEKNKETTMESECRLGEGTVVKIEKEAEEGEAMGGSLVDMMREPFELHFDDYDESPVSCSHDEEDEKFGLGLGLGVAVEMKNDQGSGVNDVVMRKSTSNKVSTMMKKKKKVLLRLDYEAVSTAWASQGGSPWITGDRPDFDPDACLPYCMSACNVAPLHQNHHHYMDLGGVGGLINTAILSDGGREARVSRYREKRRTRLFSKKIRYEVRKLNAEKRPRMKGRFVKRASFIAGLPTTLSKLK